MSAVKPTFVTGARCKIRLDEKVIAFATNVSYQIEVQHVPVEVLGAYEVIAYEPVAYRVSGTMTVVRYTKNSNEQRVGGANANGEGNSTFATGTDAGVKAAFNPANLLLSQTVDLEVFDRRDGDASKNGVQFVKLRDARMDRRGGGINARGLLEEQWSFNAIMMDDDTAAVAASGPNAG